MRSIRLSLIVYLLLLLTAALAAVSFLVYETTASTLRARERSALALIDAQYEAHCDEARSALDRRIQRQAQTLASLARCVLVHYEGLYSLGALGAAPLPQSNLQLPVWLSEGAHIGFLFRLHRIRPVEIHIESPDDLVPSVDANQPQEYFQTYRENGQPQQRSESMGTWWFALDPKVRAATELLEERFDDVEPAPGVKLRRVTLKANVARFAAGGLPWPYRFGPFRGHHRMPPPPPMFDASIPALFIQYASDTGPLHTRLGALARQRDQQRDQVADETQAQLRDLRTRLGGIALLALTAVALGSLALVRFGLAPLTHLSEAVSRVSPVDFHLDVDHQVLPAELRPIAARMQETLADLKQAFAREKQAAADISHELRTPLAALLTTIEVALRKSRNVAEYREILQECQFSGRQMSHLVERLLALARLDAGADRYRPRPVDLSTLTEECVELVRPLARARELTLDMHIDEPQTLETDPDKFREVLINLLHNAIEYNRPGGSVEVTLEGRDGQVVLEVRDTGIGIAPEALPHVFERFYRADPSRHADAPHAGLGLAIVKSYVDLMRGRIHVESNAKGSTFRVELPATARVSPLASVR